MRIGPNSAIRMSGNSSLSLLPGDVFAPLRRLFWASRPDTSTGFARADNFPPPNSFGLTRHVSIRPPRRREASYSEIVFFFPALNQGDFSSWKQQYSPAIPPPRSLHQRRCRAFL